MQVETATEITTSIYDAANQLQWSEDNAGLTTYTYDANGNQTSVQSPSEERTTYLWDYENRLAVLQQADDSLITYTYDPANQQDEYLVLKETEEDATHYLWDNNNILQEYDLSTQVQYNYAGGPASFGRVA